MWGYPLVSYLWLFQCMAVYVTFTAIWLFFRVSIQRYPNITGLRLEVWTASLLRWRTLLCWTQRGRRSWWWQRTFGPAAHHSGLRFFSPLTLERLLTCYVSHFFKVPNRFCQQSSTRFISNNDALPWLMGYMNSCSSKIVIYPEIFLSSSGWAQAFWRRFHLWRRNHFTWQWEWM